MEKVITTVPKERIERYGVEIPENIELIYTKRDYDKDEFVELAKDARCLFLSVTELPGEIIKKLPNLKLIQSEGVGFDGIDTETAREEGIYVCNARGVNKEAVAEHTVGLMLATTREIVRSHNGVLEDRFTDVYSSYEDRKIKGLNELKVGMVGMGDIGQEVVKRLKAFGCEINYYNRSRKKDLESKFDINYMDLDELYRSSDIISLHLPLMENTKDMINMEAINKMKDDVIIINTSRGGLINQEDLKTALEESKIAGAGLDTFEPEPMEKDHPLMNLSKEAVKKVVFTPHVAGITGKAFRDMQIIGFENIERVMRGEKPKNIVNGL